MSHKRDIGVVALGMASLPDAKSLVALADKIAVHGVYSPSRDRRDQFSETFCCSRQGRPSATLVRSTSYPTVEYRAVNIF